MPAGVGLGLNPGGSHSPRVSASLPAVLGAPVQVCGVTFLFCGNFQPLDISLLELLTRATVQPPL